MGPVIDHLARTGNSACLKEIYSETLSAEDAEVGPDPIGMKVADATLRDVILREAGDELDIHPVVRQRDRHIGLSSAEGGVELLGL